MGKQIFVNLPVKDLNRSEEFFRGLGYGFVEARSEFARAASLTRNARERDLMPKRARDCASKSAARKIATTD